MNPDFSINERGPLQSLLLITIIIFLSRIPFLFDGYGSEEDAWGLILTARNISLTGIYEVSRLPGHPVQEIFLSLLWQLPAWSLNLLTAIFSTIGIFFFMLTLRWCNLGNYLPAGIAMAFTPVMYINSTNIMDYTWALSMVMIAMYFVATGRYIVAGILIGWAIGFRITAGAMLIPFTVWLWQKNSILENLKNILLLWVPAGVVAVICYLPPYLTYGSSFFTYYEYFPYPPFAKNFYKGTVAAWGTIGFAVIIIASITSLVNFYKKKIRLEKLHIRLLAVSLTVIALYSYSYFKIPQKAAFVIPMVPFIWTIFAILNRQKQMIFYTAGITASCFLLGINFDHPLRGSTSSGVAIHTSVAGEPVIIDLLKGPVPAEQSKRNQKIKYAREVAHKMNMVRDNTLVISGWWQNEISYFSLNNPNPYVKYVYYEDEEVLVNYKKRGFEIVHLPEQDEYNDLRFGKTFTLKYSKPF